MRVTRSRCCRFPRLLDGTCWSGWVEQDRWIRDRRAGVPSRPREPRPPRQSAGAMKRRPQDSHILKGQIAAPATGFPFCAHYCRGARAIKYPANSARSVPHTNSVAGAMTTVLSATRPVTWASTSREQRRGLPDPDDGRRGGWNRIDALLALAADWRPDDDREHQQHLTDPRHRHRTLSARIGADTPAEWCRCSGGSCG